MTWINPGYVPPSYSEFVSDREKGVAEEPEPRRGAPLLAEAAVQHDAQVAALDAAYEVERSAFRDRRNVLMQRVRDVRDRHSIAGARDAALREFGAITSLVNNAGMAPRQRLDILEMTEDSYDEVMAVNLKGPFRLSALVGTRMAGPDHGGSDGGSIIFVSFQFRLPCGRNTGIVVIGVRCFITS